MKIKDEDYYTVKPKHIIWSPYLSGGLIGLLQLPLYFFLEKNLSSSGGFGVFGDYLLSVLGVRLYQDEMSFMTWWSVVLLIGIAIGAYISAKQSSNIRGAISTYWQQKDSFYSKGSRYLLGFIGGFFMILGARIAGDAPVEILSGIAKLQFSTFIVLGTTLVTGYFMARWLYGDREE